MAQIWPDVCCTTERGQYKSVKWSSRLFFGQGKTKQTRFLTCVWGKVECFHFMIMFFQISFPYIPFFFPFTTLFCFALFSFSTLLLWKAVRKEDIRAVTIWRDLKLKKKGKANKQKMGSILPRKNSAREEKKKSVCFFLFDENHWWLLSCLSHVKLLKHRATKSDPQPQSNISLTGQKEENVTEETSSVKTPALDTVDSWPFFF